MMTCTVRGVYLCPWCAHERLVLPQIAAVRERRGRGATGSQQRGWVCLDLETGRESAQGTAAT